MTLAETYRLSARYTDDSGTVFMTGLQALARLPVEQLRADRRAGLSTAAFVSGYPGSPMGGFDGEVERARAQASDLPIVHKPAVNEEQAATAVMGSQLASIRPDSRYDGVLGLWYGKGPGVDRAGDAIRHAVFAGTDPRGGAVALAGDDPQAKSSTIPSSSAGTLADMHVPVLYPGTPSEALDLGRHAVSLSRTTGLWTSLKIVSDVADGSGTVHLHPDRIDPIIPTVDGEPYSHVPDGLLLTPKTVNTEREIYEIRHRLAIDYAAQNRLNRVTVGDADAWIGIVASGITYWELREALNSLGLDDDRKIAGAGIRLLRMHMPLPFSAEQARRFARGLEEVFVVEEKHPNIESLLKDALYNEPMRPRVVGKYDERDELLLPGHGGLAADDLAGPLRRRLGRRVGHMLAPERRPRERIPLAAFPPGAARTPYFCSGCPHNRSTRVPDGAVVGGGIGCHTMTLLMNDDSFGDIMGITCMGQEGTQWIGMAPFVDTPHIFQNLGDGTYFHSGQMAVAGAVAAGVNMTYKLLWNQAVAMTGGQDPQGLTSVGDVARVLLAQGAARVLVTTEDPRRYRPGSGANLPDGVDVWPRRRLMEAQEMLASVEGVTVLIHDQQCAAEARRGRKRGTVAVPRQRVLINERICEGCGDCARISNCLSVQPVDTPFGRKTRIDQTSCNLDFSCLEGDCPSFMTVTRPGRLRSWLRKAGGGRSAGSADAAAGAGGPAPRAPEDLEQAEPVVPDDDLAVRITGIGGTGVVTVSQIIGTAAMFDGYEVRGLDQIGLSQKAGPVVSDLRLRKARPADSNRLGAEQADLLLAFDQLVAASPAGMSRSSPARTVVVGSTSPTPPGAAVADPDLAVPGASELTERIAAVTRDGHRHWADAQRLTTALFGDSVTANVFVLGMAVQVGALPLAAASVEQAIELNGVAVARNVESFRWGRAQAGRPEAVAAATGSTDSGEPAGPALDPRIAARVAALRDTLSDAPADGEGRGAPTTADGAPTTAEGADPAGCDGLSGLDGGSGLVGLERMARELCAYQSPRLAGEYLDFVEAVAEADRGHSGGLRRLTEAAARGYFKLLAYKDEYEVARLMLDPEATAEARRLAAGTGGRLAWKLHPPLLRAMGLKSKISFSTAWTPAFRLLAAGRRLRGTPFDVFGYTSLRRAERSLLREYRAAVTAAAARLADDPSPDAYAEAVELAELPQSVRGYEHIKMAGIKEMRKRLSRR